MYSSTTTTGTATSITCHVTMIMITMVAATSIVPDITNVIVYGMSKSNMLKSDEACIIQRMKNFRYGIYFCGNITEKFAYVEYFTRVIIRPIGVESKNNIGALNTESMSPEKNFLDAFRPK